MALYSLASTTNIIISLPKVTADTLYSDANYVFKHPWRYFPPIPPHVRRVWVYVQEPVDAITCCIVLDHFNGKPLRLYQLEEQLPHDRMRAFYGFPEYNLPCVAPDWLMRDYLPHLDLILKKRRYSHGDNHEDAILMGE